MQKMKVGVLGTGTVGQTLAAGFAALGWDVMMGSRDAKNEKAQAFAKEHHAKAGTFADAAKHGELIVLATLGEAAEAACRQAGLANFKGKTVIDTTNPLEFSTGKPQLSVGWKDSLGEQVQRLLADAHVVKAFNTVGAPHMVHPKFKERPDMFIAGNDQNAKGTVGQLLETWGWGTVDLGGIEASRFLEPMCLAWVTYGMRTNSWNHAFKLVRG